MFASHHTKYLKWCKTKSKKFDQKQLKQNFALSKNLIIFSAVLRCTMQLNAVSCSAVCCPVIWSIINEPYKLHGITRYSFGSNNIKYWDEITGPRFGPPAKIHLKMITLRQLLLVTSLLAQPPFNPDDKTACR